MRKGTAIAIAALLIVIVAAMIVQLLTAQAV